MEEKNSSYLDVANTNNRSNLCEDFEEDATEARKGSVTDSSVLDRKIERAQSSKRKRIHMDVLGCHELSQSEEGALPLLNPQAALPLKDVNAGLHPVVRNKKRKTSESRIIDKMSYSVSSSQGFVSASHMYDISSQQDCFKAATQDPTEYDSFPKTYSRRPQKQIKQIAMQGNLLSFVSRTSNEKPISTASDSGLNELSSSKCTSSTTLMFSPVKKMNDNKESCIYLSDSPSSSPGSSHKSHPRDKPDVVPPQNAVIKKLFEAAKNFNPKIKPKGKQLKNKGSVFKESWKHVYAAEETKELVKLESESDLELAFASDMEDSSGFDRKEIAPSASTMADKYGLLGSGSYPREEKTNYFEHLPFEVLENIFCQLPMLDLCLNSNRVCTDWNRIIANKKFVPWKKLYHKLKADVGGSRAYMKETMYKHNMDTPGKYLINLIRYMKNFKPVTASNMLECLEKHSKYCWAKDLIKERLPDCIIHEAPNPWSVITVLVIVAHNVYEIQEIIQCLSVSWSQCTSKEIIECLYCIASFLYAFKLAKSADVWNSMHYRLFYALYLFENTSSSSCSDLQSVMSESRGQQSLMKYSSGSESVRLTHEQLRIVKHKAGPREVIKIVAFAGTGKTTTLVRYTQFRPDKKFLLIVYNKSVCDHAKNKFPPNVECRTGHSLAFKMVGRKYSHKLFNLKVYTLTQALKARKGENLFLQAKNVLTTLENFFASADEMIDMQHVPDMRIDDKTGKRVAIEQQAKQGYVRDAQYIWGRMKDFRDQKIGMTHDGYLKLYQLSHPPLRGYDCILIDEAQDLTPAITDILLRQWQGKILVGDPHQQIYSFRGAINAMNQIQADTIFYLTQSFRFGPEIAQVAMTCLEVLKKEKKKTLVGSSKKSYITGEKVGQLAVISRCNFTVFSEAVKKCCYSDEKCIVAFVGGTENFGFPMLMDMYALLLGPQERQREGYEIQNKFIKMFDKFKALEDFATKAVDTELLGKIKIVKTYNHNLPQHIRKIESMCVRDERQADYVFSTAHKAKGLEFSTVRVTDDFLGDPRGVLVGNLGLPEEQMEGVEEVAAVVGAALGLPGSINEHQTKDEENLLYVAVTRAKNALQLSPTLVRILKQAGEKFEFPAYSKNLQDSGCVFKCLQTDSEFKPNSLTLERKTIKLGDGQEKTGGLYSPEFLSEDFHSYAALLGLMGSEKQMCEQKKTIMIPPDLFFPHENDDDML